MSNIAYIRKANLLQLIAKYDGTQKQFAEKVNTNNAYISQIVNGSIGQNGKPANIGNNLARKIEKHLGLEDGYMDVPHNTAPQKQSDTTSREPSANSLNDKPTLPVIRDGIPYDQVQAREIHFWEGDEPLDDDEFEVPYYKDVELLAGDGLEAPSFEDGRRKIKYGKTAAYKSGASQTQSLCLTLTGDSMEDLIKDGSMIAIDTSKKEIREGKIYAFRHDKLLRVKYLIPRPDGGILIRSHNKDYEDEIVTGEEMNTIHIIGWVWNWSVLQKW